MATKKYYAVKKGRITGVFQSWDECKSSVDGFPGAEYKGFATLEEAKLYMGSGSSVAVQFPQESDLKSKRKAGQGDAELQIEFQEAIKGLSPDTLLTYVDGSFEQTLGKYSFGCVFLLVDGRIYTEYGNGDNEQSLQHRNVTGEMLGAMYAVKTAMLNGFKRVILRYDYEGVEKWVTGEWRSKTQLTQKYAKAMREWGESIEIEFTKVPAHENVYFNEMADQLAKTGLTEGDGVPKVRPLEELNRLQ